MTRRRLPAVACLTRGVHAAALGALLVAAGCQALPADPQPLGGGPPPKGQVSQPTGVEFDQWVLSSAGSYRVEFRTEPPVIPLNEPFRVVLRVRSATTGDLLPQVRVGVDAGMPQHRHGMRRQPLQRVLADGSVLAEGLLFHMPGNWTLTFDLTRGAITERAEVVVAPR